jgi:hypothetical protein
MTILEELETIEPGLHRHFFMKDHAEEIGAHLCSANCQQLNRGIRTLNGGREHYPRPRGSRYS